MARDNKVMVKMGFGFLRGREKGSGLRKRMREQKSFRVRGGKSGNFYLFYIYGCKKQHSN